MELKRQSVGKLSPVHRKIHRLYIESFPKEERLPYQLLWLSTCRSIASIEVFFDGDTFVGFAYILQNLEHYFVFFLAIDSQKRSKGYGSLILSLLKEEANHRPLTLAIEPIDKAASNYPQRIKRLSFYQKNGLHITPYVYYEGQEMYQLMTTKSPLDTKSLEQLIRRFTLGVLPIRIS